MDIRHKRVERELAKMNGTDRPTCFFYRNSDSNGCGILSERVCKYKKCTFFITEKQYREGMKKYPPITSKDGHCRNGY